MTFLSVLGYVAGTLLAVLVISRVLYIVADALRLPVLSFYARSFASFFALFG